MSAVPDPRFRDQLAEAIYTAGDISGVPWERAKANPFREAKAMLQADAVIALAEARVQAAAPLLAKLRAVEEIVERHCWGAEDPLDVRDALHQALRGVR